MKMNNATRNENIAIMVSIAFLVFNAVGNLLYVSHVFRIFKIKHCNLPSHDRRNIYLYKKKSTKFQRVGTYKKHKQISSSAIQIHNLKQISRPMGTARNI